MYSNLVSRYSTIKVKFPKTGEKIEARFTRLAIYSLITYARSGQSLQKGR